MLLGREAEQRVVDEMLHKACGGRSAVLVLRGEPGIGKTALLGYAERSAADMTVLRCAGVEAEHEFPFAGLHQLLRPCLGLMDRLAAPQQAAIRSAFGLSSRTVEYHLGKVFTKLGVASRVELARLLLEPALTGQSA